MKAVADQYPDCDRWFNLGLSSDRGYQAAKLERCAAAGHRALLVNVDIRALGARERYQRNGFTAPPALTLSSPAGHRHQARVVGRLPSGRGDPLPEPGAEPLR
jgi:L-lactate dehydrogenase (cytochrome)